MIAAAKVATTSTAVAPTLADLASVALKREAGKWSLEITEEAQPLLHCGCARLVVARGDGGRLHAARS